MQELNAKNIRASTKTHLRRKLELEFKSTLQFEDLLCNNRLFIIPETLSKTELKGEFVKLHIDKNVPVKHQGK